MGGGGVGEHGTGFFGMQLHVHIGDKHFGNIIIINVKEIKKKWNKASILACFLRLSKKNLAYSKISKEEKQTRLFQELKKTEAKRTWLIPEIRKIEGKRTLLLFHIQY